MIIGRFILRFGLGIVFLYFGISQINNPEKWIYFLPTTFLNLNILDPKLFIYLNGFFDLIIGIFLILGWFIKIVSILAFLHLCGIALFSLGLSSPSGIRDLGLAFASLALFFLKNKS